MFFKFKMYEQVKAFKIAQKYKILPNHFRFVAVDKPEKISITPDQV